MGLSAAAGQIAAHTAVAQIGLSARVGGRLVRRAAGPSFFPSGVFAGCWSAGPGETAALARLVRPGGVLAVEGASGVETTATPPAAAAGAADCVFCPELRFRLNRIAGLPGAAAILAGDEEFFLIPDLAPVAEGHLLLVSTGHHLCAGALPADRWDAMELWLDRVSRLYRTAYGTADVLAFEHGPAHPQAAGACVDHLHLHLLPGTPALSTVIEATGLTGVPSTAGGVRALHAAGRSYLLVGGTVYPVEAPRSQVLRWAALTAVESGTAPVWRWQEVFGLPANRDRFLSTLGRLLPAADGLILPRSSTTTR